jgi:hypothetical protein
MIFAYFRGHSKELTINRVSTKVHVFTGMPHHFVVYDLPHPHVAYDLPSAKICQIRVLESIRWALADGDSEVDKAWKIEPVS